MSELERVQPMPSFETIVSFVEAATPERVRWVAFLVPVEILEEADNIRPFDENHIRDLACSIREIGQKQECQGDIVYDENGNLHLRIIAGLHRKRAVHRINMDKGEEEKDLLLRVSIADRPLNPYEVIEIQMAENLQNKMTPAQDAYVINRYWQELRELEKNGGKKITKIEYSKKIGRSTDVVNNAIKFVEELNPYVQKMVDEKILSYSLALLLTELDKGEGYESKQVKMALIFFAKKFKLEQARDYLKNLKMEEMSTPLFGKEQWAELNPKPRHVVAIKKESDRNALISTRWFKDMAEVIKIFGRKVEISDAVKDGVSTLGEALEAMKKDLETNVSKGQYEKMFKDK